MESKLKVKLGRPTKYDPEFCQDIIDFCTKGGFLEEYASKIGVHMDTLTEWKKVHPAFSSAYKKAKQGNLRYLLKQSRLGATGRTRNFQVGMMIFLLKACHGLREEGPNDQDDSDLEFDTE